jgi:glycosyltransferase involved in cell wall biosynthesis
MLTLAEMTPPCLRLDIDVAEGIPNIPEQPIGRSAACAWILVRMHTEPLGVLLLAIPPEGISARQLADSVEQELGSALSARARACDGQWPGPVKESGFVPSSESPFLASRKEVLAKAPHITVVVCTRARPSGLAACLDSLVRQEFPRFSILVVDNAPRSSVSRTVVQSFGSNHIDIEYMVESKLGLSWARNAALSSASAGIMAFIDDDEVADRWWLAEIARGFVSHRDAQSVSGIMLPAQLDTSAQVRFEQYGGHHKHRGFEPATFSAATFVEQHPMYPLPPFGTGGNMAFQRDSLREIGGFDTALGAGTLALGGADTRAFTELLLRGGTIVYQPTAITHHYHRRTKAELRSLMFAYGAGLTAFYSSLVLADPRRLVALGTLVPNFLRDARGPGSLRSGDLTGDFPPDLRWSNRRGLVSGPARYLASRVVDRRVRRAVRSRAGG